MGRRKRIKLCNGLPGGTVTKIHGGGADVGRGEFVVRVTLECCRTTGRVLFLEAGDSFVEILLSFLALPVGSIVRLRAKGVPGGLNGISNILDSLETFSELMQYVDKLTDDLGAPPSSMDSPKRPEDVLQLVLSNVKAVKDVVLYECGALCNRASTRHGARCTCDGSFSKLSILTLALSPEQELHKEVMLYDCGAHCNRLSANFGARCPCSTSTGYFFDLSPLTLIVAPELREKSKKIMGNKQLLKAEDSVKKGHLTYIVTNSLEIVPNSIARSISIMSKAKVEKVSDLISMEVPVTPRQILQLLRASLTSLTALSSVFGYRMTVRNASSEDPPPRSGLGHDHSERIVEESLNKGNSPQEPCGSEGGDGGGEEGSRDHH